MPISENADNQWPKCISQKLERQRIKHEWEGNSTDKSRNKENRKKI